MNETTETAGNRNLARLKVAADELERVLATAGATINFPAIPAAAVLLAVEEFDKKESARAARRSRRKRTQRQIDAGEMPA